ncbi:MAG: orotate phosphoribosyltransferase [bacterium]
MKFEEDTFNFKNMTDNLKERLKELIKTRAFKGSDTPSFPLASGKKSCFYFNMKKVTFLAEGQSLVGQIVYDKIQELALRPKAVGGLTLGADPIATSVSFTSFINKNPINAFIIRKERKDHGMGLQIEGNVEKGDTVVILDDVITTGKSTLQAINIAREHELNILCAIALVDRCEENGQQNIEAEGIKVYSIYTIHDFKV